MDKLVYLLDKNNLTIATAESCTGGLLGYKLSVIPGASKYYKGTITAYSNSVKKNILKVPDSIFKNSQVISKECAIEMVLGLMSIISANIYISITGNAGPGYNKETLRGVTYYAIMFNDKIETGTVKCVNMERTAVQKIIVKTIAKKIVSIIDKREMLN